MKKLSLPTMLVITLAVSAIPTAYARTPDGQPPAVESVCDGESGAAYGVCNAYCEAMDCDCLTDPSLDCVPNASAQACDRVKARYQRITGNSDLPCECTSNPIGYWPLDGNGTEQVNGLPGTLWLNASFVPGVVGGALDLPGDGSFLDAGAHAVLTDHGGSQMSVVAWVYREVDGPAGDSDGAIMTARTNCNEGNWQLYGNLGGSVYYSKWLNGDEDQIFSGSSIPIATWTHIAVTYSANEVRFFVNGSFFDAVTPLPFGGPINDFVQNIQIGFDSCGSFWTGKLDEVAVYKTTLSDAEIALLYVRGLNGMGIPLCGGD